MMRRSFQLSGSYDIIKDATDLASKSLGFQFLRFFKLFKLKVSALQVFIDLLFLKPSVIGVVLHFCFYLLSDACRIRESLIMIVFP